MRQSNIRNGYRLKTTAFINGIALLTFIILFYSCMTRLFRFDKILSEKDSLNVQVSHAEKENQELQDQVWQDAMTVTCVTTL